MDCVLFDLDDTLYDQVRPFALAYQQVLGEGPQVDVEALFRASRRYSDAAFAASERGEIPMDEMYVYRLQMAFRDLGAEVDAATCLAMQRAYAHNQEHAITLLPGMAEVLDGLRERGCRLGIVTNGPGQHQLAKAAALGMERWVARDATLVSAIEGVAKPNPALYLRACERLGTTPERCVFVGDAYVMDISGAVAAGIPAIWFNHRHRNPDKGPAPDYTVYSVDELRSLLETL